MIDMLPIIKGQTGDKWPRGMGNPFRADNNGNYFIAYSAEDVLHFMELNNFNTVYGTVYSFSFYENPKKDRENAIIDCIPFDLDSEEANEEVLGELRFIINWCIRHDITPRITFSGSKGFHLIIDFDEIELDNPKETIRNFGFKIVEGGQLKCVDNIVLGDLNRILRFVNTQHRKTQLYCIPLTVDEALTLSIEEIRELAKEPRDMIPVRVSAPEIVRETLKTIDKEVSRSKQISKLQGSALQNIWCYGPKRRDNTCYAFNYIQENGAAKGNRDLVLAGLIHYFKSKDYTKRQILKAILIINELFAPPLDIRMIEYKIEYHLRNDYSYCTFFKQACSEECAKCSRGKSYDIKV